MSYCVLQSCQPFYVIILNIYVCVCVMAIFGVVYLCIFYPLNYFPSMNFPLCNHTEGYLATCDIYIILNSSLSDLYS